MTDIATLHRSMNENVTKAQRPNPECLAFDITLTTRALEKR